jgi:hypothetical protein
MPFDRPWVAVGGTLSPTYCTPQDVARLLGHGSNPNDLFYADDPSSGDDTMPTDTDIEGVILDVEEEIDRLTHSAWRPRQVINEYHNLDDYWKYNIGQPVTLNHQFILPLDQTKGDSIQVWLYAGSTYTEFLGVYNEARGSDFWIDYEQGILYFHSRRPIRRDKAVKVTYRYQYSGDNIYNNDGSAASGGVTYIPRDIKRAAVYLAASWFVTQNDTTMFIIDGTDRFKLIDKSKAWEERAYQILENHKELVYFRH